MTTLPPFALQVAESSDPSLSAVGFGIMVVSADVGADVVGSITVGWGEGYSKTQAPEPSTAYPSSHWLQLEIIVNEAHHEYPVLSQSEATALHVVYACPAQCATVGH